jgi:transposase
MRRQDIQSEAWFICEFLKKRVLGNRPMNDLLKIRESEFEKLHSKTDRPFIPPNRLLWACLVQMFYTGHGDRQQLELLNFNLLIRCLIDRYMVKAVWDHSVFSPNRDHLMAEALALILNFFGRLIPVAKGYALLSDEHFSINSTLVEARAPNKKFRHIYTVFKMTSVIRPMVADILKWTLMTLHDFRESLDVFPKPGHLLG